MHRDVLMRLMQLGLGDARCIKPRWLLGLCCGGWKSGSAVFASEYKWERTSLDVLRKFKPMIRRGATTWNYRAYYGSHPPPDVIWASPPCRTFTVQAWGRYRDSEGGAISTDSEDGDACVRACLACIQYCRTLNPNLIYFVGADLQGGG